MKYRLDKYLTEAQVGSRSEVKDLIRKGKVSVNGAAAKKPEIKVDPDLDEILCCGEKIVPAGLVYYMLHKPAGYVSSTEDRDGESVLHLLDGAPGKDLFPAGRLDKDTEGFLLVTNDGDLSHRLLSPKKHVDKIYYARLRNALSHEDRMKLESGVGIGDEKETLPSLVYLQGDPDPDPAWTGILRKLDLLTASDRTASDRSPEDVHYIYLVIREGRYHQVKRMLEAVGNEVVYLKRLCYGSVFLDEKLERGAYRPLTEDELDRLQQGMNIF